MVAPAGKPSIPTVRWRQTQGICGSSWVSWPSMDGGRQQKRNRLKQDANRNWHPRLSSDPYTKTQHGWTHTYAHINTASACLYTHNAHINAASACLNTDTNTHINTASACLNTLKYTYQHSAYLTTHTNAYINTASACLNTHTSAHIIHSYTRTNWDVVFKHGKKMIITGKLWKMILFNYSYVPGLGCFVTIWLKQPKSKDRGKKLGVRKEKHTLFSCKTEQIFLQDIISTGVKLQMRVHSELS